MKPKRKRKYNKPFDLCHSILFNEFPKQYTETIGVPGKFVEKINRRVHLKGGACGEMDSAYIAEPDYKTLFEKAATCLEHQTKEIDDLKSIQLGNYDTQLVVDEHLPTLIVIASHLNNEKTKKILKRTPSDITKPYFLNLGEKNITERLSNVSKIINTNKYLSTENALNLGVILLYAPRKHACEISNTVINLYLKIVEDLDFKMEYTLYSVITLMIDAYFDDENEYEELISMIDKKTSEQSKEQFASHRCTIESLEYAKEDLAKVNKDLEKANGELEKANGDLEKANGDLTKANKDLKEAKDEIANLKAENALLKNQINGK